ncbi:MAG: hypothetical protein IT435_15095 [Phycisphaerales bacterium]|nr:hypothetical protein [Phycisphaerales bacterium]
MPYMLRRWSGIEIETRTGPHEYVRRAFGFPLPFMYCDQVGPLASFGTARTAIREWHHAIRIHDGTCPRWIPAIIPTGVYWPYFAANFVVTALAIELVLLGVVRLRGIRRARRGLCVGCGYELGSAAMCPECGMPAAKTATATAPASPQ